MVESVLKVVLAASDQSQTGFNKFKRNLKGLTGAIGALKLAAAAAGGAAGLGLLAANAVKAADTLAKTADKIGFSTDSLQKFQFAAKKTGVETATLNMAMQRFTRRLGEAAIGKGELLGVLNDYNIAIKDSEGKTRATEDVLADLADTIKLAGSEQEALRIAFKSFDAEGAALVNLMRKGSDGLKEYGAQAENLGIIIEEDLLRGAESAQEAIDNLTTVLDKNFKRTLLALAPILESFSEILIKASKQLTGLFTGIRGWFAQNELRVKALHGQIKMTVEEINRLSASEAIQMLDKYQGRGEGEYVDSWLRGREPERKLPIPAGKSPKKKKTKTKDDDIPEFRHMTGPDWGTYAQAPEISRVFDPSQLGRAFDDVTMKTTEFFDKFRDGAIEAGETMANSLGGAFTNFFDDLAKGEDAFKNFGKAVLGTLQQIFATQAGQAISSAASSAVGKIAASFIHGGGMVGGANIGRRVSPFVFAGAPRLHSGLAADEYPAILQRGEQVIPRGLGGEGQNITINTIDTQTMGQWVRKHKRMLAGAVAGDALGNGPTRAQMKRALR